MAMARLAVVGALVALLGSAAAESAVVELTPELMDSEVNSQTGGGWMIKFFAPWCGHCKELAPIFEEFGEANRGKINAGSVDCDQHQAQCDKWGITGFPTILYVLKDEYYEFGGERTAESLAAWVNDQEYLNDPSKPNPTAGEGGLADTMSDEEKKVREELLQTMRSSGNAAQTVEETDLDTDGDSQVITLTPENFDDEMATQASGTWLIEFYAPWCGHCMKLEPIYETAARRLQGEVTVAKVDSSEANALAQRFGVKGFPTIKLVTNNNVDGEEKRMYDFSGPRNVAPIVEWAKGGYTKDKSEPFPDPPTDNTRKVNEKELDAIMDSSKKDSTRTFAMLYSPGCGACMAAAPHMEALTADEEWQKNNNAQVVKADVVAEDTIAKRFNVDAYPMMILIEGGNYWEFNLTAAGGERSVANLKEFVETSYNSGDHGPKHPCPGPYTFLDELNDVIKSLWRDLLLVCRVKPFAAVILFCGGVVVGSFLVVLLTPAPKPRRRIVKPQEKKD